MSCREALLLQLVTAVCVLVGGFAQQVNDCPRYCSCYRTPNGVSANCNYQRLGDLSGMVFPPDIIYLDFSFNALAEINSNTIPNMPDLLILKIEECQVGNIGADAFAHLPNLLNLTLNGNQIQDIHKDAFRGLRSLRHLFLEKNNIARLEDEVFDSLELEQLYLTDNNIQQLTSDTLKGLMVSDLRMGGNALSSLTSEMLLPVKRTMKTFTLDNNEVPLEINIDTFANTDLDVLKLRNSSLTQHAFLRYVATQFLDISMNKFGDLDFSPYTNLRASVQELALSASGIEFLDDNILAPFQGLRHLDLSENNISVLSGKVFQKVPNLESLELMANPIMQLSDSFGEHLTKVGRLGLRSCRLSDLTNPKPFLPMVALRELDLGNNLIQVVGPQIEPVLERLTSLILDGNFFHCNCEILWLYDWIVRTNQQMRFVVQGFNHCVGNTYIWALPREELACSPPHISHIIGSTEVGGHASGDGAILDVAPGTMVMLQCTGQADPAPMIQWSFPYSTAEEVVVEPNPNRTITRTSSYYELKQIRLGQSGQFKCVASNMQGTAEAHIQVNVRADLILPPTRPTTPTPTLPPKPPNSNTNTGTNKDGEKPPTDNQVATTSESDNSVKYTVIGVGVAVVVITLIVLIVVVVYVYKARQRAYQRTYGVQERLSELKYPAVDGMGNGDVSNGHPPVGRMDSSVSATSTTPFGLSHA